MSDAEAAPPNPLERFTSGGWLKGLLRLAIGIVVAAVAIYMTGDVRWDLVLDPAAIPFIVFGALVHAAQRATRVFKWAAMIEPSPLVTRTRRFLLRIQFMGLLANMVIPVSEALKIWAVSRSRRDAVIATGTIVIDSAYHAAGMGLAGLVGIALVAIASGSATSMVTMGVAVAMAVVPVVVVLAMRRLPGRRSPLSLTAPPVLGWAAAETGCQLAVYGIAARAVGLEMGALALLAVAPVLYLSDLVMVTPSGVGLREALFAIALEGTGSAPEGVGVAMGLVISAMLLAVSLVGGAIALGLPESKGGGDDGPPPRAAGGPAPAR